MNGKPAAPVNPRMEMNGKKMIEVRVGTKTFVQRRFWEGSVKDLL